MSKLEISLDTASLSKMIGELEEEMQAAARPAAQAAAQVFYDEAKRRVLGIGSVTGNLFDSIYQVYSKDNSGDGLATYHVSWNHLKAPHGHLVEFGHVQRYAAYVGRDGKWHTAVRPSQRGQRKPSRRASQATKDAYYVPLAGGPRQVPAQPFIRSALSAAERAVQAATTSFYGAIR